VPRTVLMSWGAPGRARSVADAARMLPYHVAWGRGHRAAASLLNPTVNIDAALETARESDQGARRARARWSDGLPAPARAGGVKLRAWHAA
jgi:hypothetical protein